MLKRAQALLSILGNYECGDILDLGGGVGVSYFIAEKEEFPSGKQTLPVVLSTGLNEKSATDLCERLKAADSSKNLATVWIVLCEQKEDAGLGWMREWGESRGITVRLNSWQDFRAGMLKLELTERHYRSAWEEYKEIEAGDDFIYIQPEVVSRKDKCTVNLISHIDAFCAGDEGGMVFILADYGEGKTCFCRNFVWSHQNKELRYLVRIPLIFFLNECKAGSLEEFLLVRLKYDYGISVTFEEFRSLCELGLFTIVLDAFDQMPDETKIRRLKADCYTLTTLAREKGQAILTCRSQYYAKYLRSIFPEPRVPSDPEISHLELKGFGKNEVSDFLKSHDTLCAKLFDPDNEQTLNYIYKKPLILQILKKNEKRFLGLLNSRRQEDRPVLEFDIFDMAYRIWWEIADFKGLTTGRLRTDACRSIAKGVRTYGMNIPLEFSGWFREFARKHEMTPDVENAVREDLAALQLLDQGKLKGDERKIAFRFNIYLEFLIARFVLDEIRLYGMEKLEFIRNDPLTLETRQLVITQLDVDIHGENLKTIVEDTRFKSFRDFQYQGANALSLLLDVMGDTRRPTDEMKTWDRFLRMINFRHSVLREADCRGANLRDLNFSHADLDGADLSYASLENTKLENARLTDARFEEYGGLITTAFLYHSEKEVEFLAGGTERGLVLFWSDGFRRCDRYPMHRRRITALTVSADGKRVFAGSEDETFSILPVSDPDIPQIVRLNINGICCLRLDSSGDYLVAGGQSGELLVRKLSVGTNLHSVLSRDYGKAYISAVALGDPKDVLIAGNTQGELFLLRDWDRNRAKPGPATAMLCEGSGGVKDLILLRQDLLLVLADNGQAEFYSLGTHKLEKKGDSFRARAVSFSRGANILFWLDEDMFNYGHLGNNDKLEKTGDRWCGREGAVIAASDDGLTVAVGGDNLLVFRKSSNEGYVKVFEDKMFMNCSGMIFSYAEGLNADQVLFFLVRGASWPPEEFISGFLDRRTVKVDRDRRMLLCSICGDELDWRIPGPEINDRLKCSNSACNGRVNEDGL